MTGVDFLAQAHQLHREAKRMLLVTRDYTSANPIIPAMTLGQIDYHLVKPWLPEHGLYPAVSDALASWAGVERRERLHLLPHRRSREQRARPRDPRSPHPLHDAVLVPYDRLRRGTGAARRGGRGRMPRSRRRPTRREGARRPDERRPDRGGRRRDAARRRRLRHRDHRGRARPGSRPGSTPPRRASRR